MSVEPKKLGETYNKSYFKFISIYVYSDKFIKFKNYFVNGLFRLFQKKSHFPYSKNLQAITP